MPHITKKKLKAFFFHHVFCTIILFSQTFSLTSRRKETIISCARWKTVISANEIQWIRPLKRCSEQDNSVWLITLFLRYSERPVLLSSFRETKQSSHPVWAHLFLTLLFWITITSAGFSQRRFSLSFSFAVTVHFTHFDGRFISISGMRAAMSVGVCRMFQHLDTVS